MFPFDDVVMILKQSLLVNETKFEITYQLAKKYENSRINSMQSVVYFGCRPNIVISVVLFTSMV